MIIFGGGVRRGGEIQWELVLICEIRWRQGNELLPEEVTLLPLPTLLPTSAHYLHIASFWYSTEPNPIREIFCPGKYCIFPLNVVSTLIAFKGILPKTKA